MRTFCIKAMALSSGSWQQGMAEHHGQLDTQALIDTIEDRVAIGASRPCPRIAYSWCHSPALADELVQKTMEKALRNTRQLRDSTAVKSWLSRILANCWYDYLRRNRETVDLDRLSWEDQSRGEDIHEQQDIVKRVRAMVAWM